LDRHGVISPRRIVAVAGDIRLFESIARRGRRAAGFSGNDALRKRLRAGRTVGAAGVTKPVTVLYPWQRMLDLTPWKPLN